LTDEDALKKRHQPRIAASTMLLVSRFQGLNSARRAADVDGCRHLRFVDPESLAVPATQDDRAVGSMACRMRSNAPAPPPPLTPAPASSSHPSAVVLGRFAASLSDVSDDVTNDVTNACSFHRHRQLRLQLCSTFNVE